MTTAIEYALMAGASYMATRTDTNEFPIPQGWSAVTNPPHFVDDTTGFEAVAFQRGTEIVISFAGTYPADFTGDMAANLALAAGSLSDQLKQAADYYLAAKASTPANATITFTGHSLGGGLASLMAVMFGESATTFDQAPFLNSAKTFTTTDPDTGYIIPRSVAIELRAYLADHVSESELARLDAFIAASDPFNADPIQADTLASRSLQVSNINTQGEFISSWFLIPSSNRIGSQAEIADGNNVGGLNLHSIAVLTAMMQSGDTPTTTVADHTLGQVTITLPDLLSLLFDNNLYANDTDTDKQNLLDRFVQHQAGKYDPETGTITLTPDQMVTRFTADLWMIAQDGGLTLHDNNPSNPDVHDVSNALIAYAMQFYYQDTANALDPNKGLFSSITGGIQFDMKDVADYLGNAKGYENYFRYYLESTNNFTTEEQALIIPLMPAMRDWYVQAGTAAMNAVDTLGRGAFMLGGADVDTLIGGDNADLLVGNGGADVMKGGIGNDTLVGGEGADTLEGGLGKDQLEGGQGHDIYIYNSGDGSDTIVDADGDGVVQYDGSVLSGGMAAYQDGNVFVSADGNFGFTRIDSASGTDLWINNTIRVENYHAGDLGIVLSDFEPDSGQYLNATLGDLNDPNFPNYGYIPGPDGVPRTWSRYEDFNVVNYNVTGISWEGDIYSVGADAADTHWEFVSENITASIEDWNIITVGGSGGDRVVTGDGSDFVSTVPLRPFITGVDSPADPNLIPGSSWIYVPAEDGPDYVDMGAGRDFARTSGGNDTIYLGSDQDFAEAGWGDDYVDGGDGGDFLSGGPGADLMQGGDGDDLLYGDSNYSPLFDIDSNWRQWTFDIGLGLSGDGQQATYNQTLYSISRGTNAEPDGNDILYGGRGMDFLYGEGGDDILSGDEGVDVLIGGPGSDLLIGGTEGDWLNGDAGNSDDPSVTGDDVLLGGDGIDHLFGGPGNDVLYGGADGDFLNGDIQGNSSVVGQDVLYGDGGDDQLVGGPGDDYLDGGEGADILIGDDDGLPDSIGNDILIGDAGNDYLDGGPGTDVLVGGADNDTYIVDSPLDVVIEDDGKGFDTVYSTSDYVLPDNVEYLVLSSGAASNATGNASANWLYGNEEDNIIYGVGGNDALYGGSGSDILDGGTGTDILYGDAGNDIFRFGRGYGTDTVITNDTDPNKIDAVELAEGILTTDVALSRGPSGSIDDLIIRIAGTADTLIIPGYFSQNGTSTSRVEEIRFAGGTVWDVSAVMAIVAIGTEGNDNLTGSTADDSLYGLGGTDTLHGAAGNDYLDGGAGNDTLYGDADDDTLYGGTGNDTLYGGTGNDTYRFGVGDGIDAINNGDASVNRLDVIEFTGSLTPGEITASRTGNNLVLRIAASGETLTVNGYFNQDGAGQESVDEIRFTDGTAWDIAAVKAMVTQGTSGADTLYGYATDDTLDGLAGNDTLRGREGNDVLIGGADSDTLYGEQGNDTYVFGRGDGQDTIYNYTNASSTDIDRILFRPDVSPADVTLLHIKNASEDSLRLSINGTSDAIVVTDYFSSTRVGAAIDNIEFDDGTVWTEADIRARLTTGTEGYDTIIGFDTPDVIDGLGGDDVIDGGAGADTLWGGEGADRVYGGTGDDEIHGGPGDDSILRGDDGDDTIYGDAGADKLYGGNNNDTLDGGSGDDYLSGGYGDDTYLFYRGAGFDDLWESREETGGGSDTVQLTGGILPEDVTLHRDGDNLIVVLDQSPTQLRLNNFFFNETHPGITYQIERIVFDNGDQWDLQTIYQNVESGSADVFTGTSGDDVFTVDNQSDVVSENINSGTDTIESSVTYGLPDNVENLTLTGYVNVNGTGNSLPNIIRGNAGNNVLDGGSLETDQLIGGAGDDTYYVDHDTVIENAGEGEDWIVIKGGGGNYPGLPDNVENLRNESHDGGRAYLYGNGLDNMIVSRTLDNDIVYGRAGDDIIYGGASANLLYGEEGNDKLYGLAGVDELYGGDGNDLLNGGDGDDYLAGGPGDDTYVVNYSDSIVELPAEGVDTVMSGQSFSLMALTDVENITLMGGGNVDATGNDSDNVLVGNSGANTLTGGLGADALTGGAGDDVLDGGDGDDIYHINAGDGFALITDSSGNDSIVFGPGISFGDVKVFLNSGGLYLSIQNPALGIDESVYVENWSATPVIESFVFEGEGTVSAAALLAPQYSTFYNDELGQWVTTIRISAGYVLTSAGGSDNGEISGTDDDNLMVASGHVIGNAGDDVIYGLNADDLLEGDDGSDRLVGGRGSDVLDGGTGADELLGGDGNDTYYVDDVGDLVTEVAGQGTDTVNSSISYTLTANVEHLTLLGAAVIDGTGNAQSNTITGNGAGNVLTGAAGNDTLRGMGGNDTLYGDAGNDVLETGYGFDYAYGGAGNDTITGGDNVNGGWTAEYLYGEDGDDLIRGGGKYAHLYGGAGNDELRAGSGYQQLYGEDGDDTLIAGTSTYIMNGGTGADLMVGSGYSNYYWVDDVGDVVVEAADGGVDTVNSSISYTLTANVEHLTLLGAAVIDGTGNAQSNTITGNGAGNVLTGDGGNDTLRGMGGDDTLYGGAGNDTLIGGQGSDTYTFFRDNGVDTIRDYDVMDADPDVYGATADVIQVDTDITHDQLWFMRSGNDLLLQVIGTPDQMTIQGWYNGSEYQVEEIHAGDGYLLLNDQVDQLVQAMAGFAPPQSGELDLPANYRTDLEPVLAANWQSA